MMPSPNDDRLGLDAPRPASPNAAMARIDLPIRIHQEDGAGLGRRADPWPGRDLFQHDVGLERRRDLAPHFGQRRHLIRPALGLEVQARAFDGDGRLPRHADQEIELGLGEQAILAIAPDHDAADDLTARDERRAHQALRILFHLRRARDDERREDRASGSFTNSACRSAGYCQRCRARNGPRVAFISSEYLPRATRVRKASPSAHPQGDRDVAHMHDRHWHGRQCAPAPAQARAWQRCRCRSRPGWPFPGRGAGSPHAAGQSGWRRPHWRQSCSAAGQSSSPKAFSARVDCTLITPIASPPARIGTPRYEAASFPNRCRAQFLPLAWQYPG